MAAMATGGSVPTAQLQTRRETKPQAPGQVPVTLASITHDG